MIRILPVLLLAIGAIIILRGLLPERNDTAFRFDDFAALPVLEGGRVKPLDTVARVNLLILRGKQSALDADGETISPHRWIADVALDRNRAADYRVFRVDDPDVLGLLRSRDADVRHYSYRELQPFFEEIERQYEMVPEETQQRNRYQRALVKLRNSISIYQNLTYSFYPRGTMTGPVAEYEEYAAALPHGMQAILDREAGREVDDDALTQFLGFAGRYQQMAESQQLLVIPPRSGDDEADDWMNVGTALIAGVRDHTVDPAVMGYARLAQARQAGDAEAFNAGLDSLIGQIDARQGTGAARTGFEYFYNQFQPFYVSMTLYVLIFLVAAGSWITQPRTLADSAYRLLLLAFAVHTFGLAARVYLSGYAPVTNLYSSAVFVGWGAVLVSLFLEKFYRIGIGSAVAAAIGFCSLLVAHHLSMDGDTMEMMRAVLDSNFWLSTHVITITIGYSAVFLAGFLGILYVARGMLTASLTHETAQAFSRMVYGVLCFALLFSFAGTVLGGIWADQSWGRFWGWDPKENGALMITIWLALALHAKRGRVLSDRGIMLLAVGGNIVTSWSWFGTNMLGIGLHSYGFMDEAFFWLLVFWISQAAIIAVGALPPKYWRSRHIFTRSGNGGSTSA